jgi:hypothetical protein
MTKEASGLENVAALILERQRIESWLATLEARKAGTPDHVYQRVRGDYAVRLKAITDQLIARSATLKTHVDQMSARLAQIEGEAQRLKDIRAESEVRMQVGELSVTDWNAKARECDEGVAKLSEAQAQARGSLAQAREILAMVSGHANPPAPAASTSTSSPRISRPVNANEVRANPTPANGAPRPPDPTGGNMDEMEFLKSVVDGHGQGNGQKPGSDSIELETEGAPDLAQTLLNRVNQRSGNLREDGDADSLLKGVGVSKPGNKTNPLAANVTESNPIVLRPQGGPERHKTLKCLECGTMNYPTEWYCERCGAELVSM